ncbi:hypothetical protein SNE35_02675 [Paucibacter sp. R3-3]|uniref:Uncharacterized protein n=1 Tax=Roseateles agri TaxID=3098619 RepID=A0ABU5DAT4_9BURK|nr:hypothetical protein [Paucibacter sp. R3-3]MDY0743387.1 hypothetical protein [Paucibacter sp. R3-3]
MNWLLAILSWVVAAYFGVGFISKAGYPPKAELLGGDALFVGLTLFFLFMPFFNKVKVGSWLELEQKVKEAKEEAFAAKEELREFKAEVRNTVSVISSNIVSPQFNVYMTDLMRQQGERVDAELNQQGREKAEEVTKELQADDDVNFALAKVRIDIERLLRTILGRSFTVATSAKPRFLSINNMFEQLVQQQPSLAFLQEPMRSVLSVCNAAVHAQIIPPAQAAEALKLGAQIIATLRQQPGAADNLAAPE